MSRLTNIVEIINFLEKYEIKNATINKDFTVDVDGDAILGVNELTEIPIQFGRVKGIFSCNHNLLTSLKGCPKWVGENFYCNGNKLITLEYAPEYVGGDFWCYRNNLTSLKGAPKKVEGEFWCDENQLKNLIGSPEYVGGEFNCNNNQIETLAGCPKIIKTDLYCENNPLITLEGIGEVNGRIYSDFYCGKLKNYMGEL